MTNDGNRLFTTLLAWLIRFQNDSVLSVCWTFSPRLSW